MQPRIPAALIVGRARCGDRTWLLLESRQLVSIGGRDDVTVQPLAGTQPSDRPWGLACASGALWTLITPKTLARLGPGGAIDRRVELPLPRVALFGFADKLLFQSMPVTVGAPALAFHPIDRPFDLRPWPGFSARSAATREDELSRNLVNCGLAGRVALPCWFVSDLRIIASDGTNQRAIDVLALAPPDADRAAPIWDADVADPARVWLLFARTSSTSKRRIVAADGFGHAIAALDLSAALRVIVRATNDRCVLVTADGSLVEVKLQ